MKAQFFILPAVFMLAISCTEIGDPLRKADLTWLEERIEEINNYSPEMRPFFYISKGQYKRKTVFIFPNCCPNCASATGVYSINGELIGYLSYSDEDIPYKAVKNIEPYFTPEDFACQFNY